MHVHIIGVCGTFMGGVAALARAAGHRVTGSDQSVYPPMSDQLQKGVSRRDTPEANRRVSDAEIGWFDELKAQGRVSTPFNWGLIFNADSRFPEIAGLSGAIVGTFYAILVSFLMVSTIRYPSFKQVNWETRTRVRTLVVVFIGIILVVRLQEVALFFLFLGYIAYGLFAHYQRAMRHAQMRALRRKVVKMKQETSE